MEINKIIPVVNPLELKQEDMPVVVLSDDRRGLIPWAIKAHTHGNYNHIMLMVTPKFFFTQGILLSNVPVEKYMKDFSFLKFYKLLIPQELKDIIIEQAKADLKKPWWKRLYDGLGIFGQLLPGKWGRIINIPGLNFCSEDTRNRLYRVGFKYPVRPNPAEMEALLSKDPNAQLLGYWFNA